MKIFTKVLYQWVLISINQLLEKGKNPMRIKKELDATLIKMLDFINNKKSTHIGSIIPSYKPGYTLCNLQEILPNFISQTLKEGILYFDNKIKGFANPDAILTGVETRSSSPVTILRNEELECNIEGIYPCGEGAGYAGGITTSAIDGLKVAEAIISKYRML